MKPVARKLSNWLEAYMEYSWNTESAVIYKKWVAVSVIASVLQRKVWFKLGTLGATYPNFFIVLVGPPGTRKSEAINYGFKLTKALEDLPISADSTTRENLIQDIENAAKDIYHEDGTIDKHCSLTAVCSELEVFLGNKKDNTKMIAFLTNMWDCPDRWEYRTKHSGKNQITNAFLNLVGATTPASMANSLPPSVHGTGFTSRIIFCYANKKHKEVAIPEETPEIIRLREALEHDLYLISLLQGEYKFTKESRAFWKEWYDNKKDDIAHRICKDVSFSSWYERKPTFVMKLAQVIAAAESNSLDLKSSHIERALELIEETEHSMAQAFTVMGRNEMVAELEMLMGIIRSHGQITEKQIMNITWSDFSATKLEEALRTVVMTGRVTRKIAGPNVVYEWKGDKPNGSKGISP